MKILDYEKSFFSPDIKLKVTSIKINKSKSQLVRIGVNIEGKILHTVDYFWVPKFMINKSGYILPTNWEESTQIIVDLKKKILEKEKEVFWILEEIREKNQSKQCIVENALGQRAKVWIYTPNIMVNRVSAYFINDSIKKGFGEWTDTDDTEKEKSKFQKQISKANIKDWFKDEWSNTKH